MSNNRVKKITDFSKQPAPVKKVKEKPVSEQVSAIDVAEVWVTDHWKLVLSCLIAITVVIVAVIVIHHTHQTAAQAELKEIAEAADIPALENVVAKYSSHPATVTASMRLASLYLEKKDYVKAYNALKAASESPNADPFFRARASIDCAGILEMQGNKAEAVKAYETSANDLEVNETQRAEAACSGARAALENKDTASAERLLKTVNTARAVTGSNDPYSVWAFKALEISKGIAPASAPAAEKK